VLEHVDGKQFIDDPSYNFQANKQYLEDWVNLKSRCEDSFTALHFASFFGNFFMIKYLLN